MSEGTVEAAAEAVGRIARRDVRGDDISLHYAEFGEGHAVVWLHGSGPGASGLSNFGPNLPAFADFRNLVFDHPRYGRSAKPVIEEPLIDYSARNMIAALDRLGVEATHLVGNSFGGSVAIRIAAERPELVGRLVVMGGGGKPGELDLNHLSEWPEGLQIHFRYMSLPEPSRDRLEELTRAMMFDPSLVTPELVEQRFAASREAHPEVRVVPPNQGNLQPHLSRVRARTLMLWGREDRFIPLEWALVTLRGIENAELRVVPRCGHWVQYEKRDYFNHAAGEFLRNGR